MRAFTRLLASAFLFLLPIQSGATSIEILSSARSVTTSAYATDDVIELTEGDADSSFTLEPYSEEVFANILFGLITCESSAHQTSAFATSAFHAEGAHSCYSQDTGTTGFGMAAGSSTFHAVFRLLQPSGYVLGGFIEGADLGFTTITFSGPGGPILSMTAGGQQLPVQQSGSLPAGDYDLNVTTYGSAHGWPPFPSYSSGAFEIHFALDSATSAPNRGHSGALQAFPNPFTSSTRIYSPDGVRGICVFDAAGRLVRTLRGFTSHRWDGCDENGAATPAGMYFIRADEGLSATSLKLVRIR